MRKPRRSAEHAPGGRRASPAASVSRGRLASSLRKGEIVGHCRPGRRRADRARRRPSFGADRCRQAAPSALDGQTGAHPRAAMTAMRARRRLRAPRTARRRASFARTAGQANNSHHLDDHARFGRGGFAAGCRREAPIERAIVERLGIKTPRRMDSRVSMLSGGNQQKVVLGQVAGDRAQGPHPRRADARRRRRRQAARSIRSCDGLAREGHRESSWSPLSSTEIHEPLRSPSCVVRRGRLDERRLPQRRDLAGKDHVSMRRAEKTCGRPNRHDRSSDDQGPTAE